MCSGGGPGVSRVISRIPNPGSRILNPVSVSYLVMEHLDGETLAARIARGPLPIPDVLAYGAQIADALSAAHRGGIIHRDLKLGNLFLSKTMNIKVGDFGLACRVDSTDEKRRTICGTPNYIAPEVIEGNKEKRGHSFEVDVWSMGVVCFTMLVGKPPYESTDVKSTYRRILSNEYSFPQGKVSGDARHLIASMLQTDPKMR